MNFIKECLTIFGKWAVGYFIISIGVFVIFFIFGFLFALLGLI
jgi:hypothetical protein